MFHHRKPRIVAVVTVEGGKPEELVTANPAAHADAPGHLVVRRGVGLRRSVRRRLVRSARILKIIKDRKRGGVVRRERRGRPGLRYPLGKGIPRAPGVLAVKEKSLSVQPVGTALGLHVHSSAGGAYPFGLGVSRSRLHLADRRLGDDGSAPSGPRLAHPVLFGSTLPARARPRRSRPGTAGAPKRQSVAGAVHGGLGRQLPRPAQRSLRDRQST